MGVAITLSRQLGASGAEIACAIAAELNLRIVGKGLIHEAIEGCTLEELGLEAEEAKPNIVSRAIDYVRGKPVIPAIPEVLNMSEPGILSTRLFSNDDYHRSVLESVLYDLTQIDDVLIIGQAGQMVLRNAPHTLHIRVVAPLEVRVQSVRKHLGISEEEAHQQIRGSDRARAEYLRHYYQADIDDVNLYDLVINIGSIPIDAAAELIVSAARAIGIAESVPQACSMP